MQLLDIAAARGQWLMLQNCHLLVKWLQVYKGDISNLLLFREFVSNSYFHTNNNIKMINNKLTDKLYLDI